MVDKSSILQIIGCLMKRPQYLSETDKYKLTPSDFYYKFDKYVFIAIENLYKNGATKINPIDVENFLESNGAAKVIFKSNNGIEYLQDAEYLSEEQNFPYYYKRLKKFNLLESLKKQGIDTSCFYMEDLTNLKANDINAEFEKLEISDIIAAVRKNIIKVEKDYVQNEQVQSWSVAEEIEELIDNFGAEENIGLSINGEILSSIINGAELGALTIRSLASGVGKTRLAVADACKLAYPFYYDEAEQEWVRNGSNEKVLFIMTEQTPEQVLKMILAYLTGINESKFRFNRLTADEQKRINVAKQIIREYKDNLQLMRIPDPNIEQIKLAVREKVIVHDIKYVFFDYVFVSPALLGEFRGHNIRNDEALLLMATALKDLAIEQNVSVFTSTQVNAKIDENKEIRNESALAGGRSTINKADNGMIGARPTKEEIDFLGKDGIINGMIPNIVFDIFKVRSGRWTQVRVWSYFDAGTLRLTDLFVTDNRLNPIKDFFNEEFIVNWEMSKEDLAFLNKINEGR